MELPELSTSPSPDALFELISRLSDLDLSPGDRDSPTAARTEEFFRNSWEAAESGLLARTRLLRVKPASRPAPRAFRFEIDLPYKRQEHDGAPIELDEGPIRGTIHYRQDLLLAAPGEPVVQVRFQDTSFLHPNFSRRWGVFCAGTLPPGPFELEPLLSVIYLFASYQLYTLGDPADVEAARIFATDPRVLDGLGDVPPLY